MQTASLGDTLHAMSNLILWEKYNKKIKMSSGAIFTQLAKC